MGGAVRQPERRERRSVSMSHFLINNSYNPEHHEKAFLDYPNETAPFCSRFSDGKWYCSILLVLFIVGLPVGLLGNMAAIVNYTCCRRPWNTGTVFLLNLALCDIVWLLLLPFTVYFNLHQPHIRGMNIFCQFKKIFFNINVYGSIFFLALISFDRYTGTVHPISSLRWWDGKKACLCSIFTWILLILSSIPDLFMTFDAGRPDNVTVCMDHIHGPFSYVTTISLIRALVGFLLPFLVMGAFYTQMAKVLRSMPERNASNRLTRKSGKPLILIMAALAVFLLSYAPYHIMIVTLVFMRFIGKVTSKNMNTLYIAYEFLEAMCSVSSCLDPLIYIFASQRFQQRWKRQKMAMARLCCRSTRKVGVQETL